MKIEPYKFTLVWYGDLDKMKIKTPSNDELEIYKAKIEEMLNDDKNRWNFADDTLSSIYDQMMQRHFITENQIKAVNNFYNSVVNT